MFSRSASPSSAERFDVFMENALYGESGFYTRGGRPAARGGDFATSVELGTLFGRCVAGYLDRVWDELGRPDPFVVVEGGAGRGTLCQQVLRSVVDCRSSLQYVMVERVARQREEAQTVLRNSDQPAMTAADLPSGPMTGVVLANELLDNLPIRLLQRSAAGWQEVHVEPPVELLMDAPADAAAMAEALAPDAEPGSRVPLQLRAAVWVRRALRLLDRGRLLVIDYGVPTTAELAARPMPEWLRTYSAHRRGRDPLGDPGLADITCEVAFDQLPPGGTRALQADWLAAEGIDDMAAPARRLWQRSRASPSADALGARALLDEAAALTDPTGMGAFWVAEWRID